MSNKVSRIQALILGFWLLLAVPVFAEDAQQLYPDVLDVEVVEKDSRWTISATISSPYDSPQRYANGFRILTENGVELGVRTLWHDHANEQPFTRSLIGVAIPSGTISIIVQGRDQKNGWGGQAVRVRLSDGLTEVLEQWPAN